MLEIVVNLINDDYKSVATKSNQVLAQYRSQSSTAEAELNTLLQDNLYDLATKLPRLVRVTGTCYSYYKYELILILSHHHDN